eukprot:6402359-Pyramimonas_sp.AAC.1
MPPPDPPALRGSWLAQGKVPSVLSLNFGLNFVVCARVRTKAASYLILSSLLLPCPTSCARQPASPRGAGASSERAAGRPWMETRTTPLRCRPSHQSDIMRGSAYSLLALSIGRRGAPSLSAGAATRSGAGAGQTLMQLLSY